MASASILVDLLNPGQVFACLGFAEAAEVLLGEAVLSTFHNAPGQLTTFEIRAGGDVDPVREVIEFLRRAKVAALVLEAGALSKWGIEELRPDGQSFPCPIPRTPATSPVKLCSDGAFITVSYWADGPSTGVDNVKFWAGAAGYPGAALARDILAQIADLPEANSEQARCDPFSVTAPMSSSFRFDWRRDYIPLDVGFSPNEHGDMTMVGYPFTEILAAIGLQYARPARVERGNKLHYRYGIWCEPLPTVAARVVLGAVDLGISRRTFSMTLGWPGQEGQARCIIDAREVNQHGNAD